MLFYFSLLLLLLSLILVIYNWELNKNAIFIALFFILIAIYGLTHYLTVYGDSVFWLALFFNTISPFMLLAGPFLYFYIRGTLKDRQGLKLKDSAHFIPAIIHFIGICPYLFTPFSYKENVARMIIENINVIKTLKSNIFFNYQFNFIFRIFLLTAYVIYSAVILWKFSRKKNNYENIPQKQFKITIRWLVLLLVLVLFLIINYFLLSFCFINYSGNQLQQNTIVVNSSTAASFAFLAFGVLFFPEVLYGLPNQKTVRARTKKKTPKSKKLDFSPQTNEIKEMGEAPFLILSERILDYFESEKPYLNPNFSISQIAQKMNVPQNHISYCINSIFKTKFSKLKTKLRVEQTKVFLRESVHSNITIDGIAQLAGFTSRSNFYNAFKDEVGITPSEYLKSIKENTELL